MYGMNGWNKGADGDLISREAAIDALSRCQTYLFDTRDTDRNISLEDAEYVIEKLPSTQPERMRGKWEIYVISMFDGEGCRCSECGFEGVPYWDFCPNCGADMREVSE